MTRPASGSLADGWTIAVYDADDPRAEAVERELVAAGLAVPFPARLAWARLQPGARLVAVRRSDDPAWRHALLVSSARSRALPGHRLLRAERAGACLDAAARAVALGALARLARSDARALRANVELFARDAGDRAAMGRMLAAEGFRRLEASRAYTHTLTLPLDGDEERIFAGLHATARRHVRALGKGKFPLALREIDDPALGDRMNALLEETMARTGGTYHPVDWPAVLATTRANPGLSRVVGLFRTDVEGDAALLAYTWGRHHGDHAEYHVGASTRDPAIRTPLAYPLMWELITWARRTGARWFDLGGVTAGGGDDPLGGISDFKRYFSERVEEVGEEWELEPHAARAALARAIGRGAAWVSRLRARPAPAASEPDPPGTPATMDGAAPPVAAAVTAAVTTAGAR